MPRKRKPAVTPVADLPWDTSTEQQRASRAWKLTERGEIDPTTGKLLNPNGVAGVRFDSQLEKLRAKGVIEDWHLDAAEKYESLVRACRGSPAQRSCLDNSPIGYDEPGPDMRDERAFRDVQRAVGMIGSNLLDRATWEKQEIPPRLHGALRAALDRAADHFGC